jgi:sarcosine oxidase
VVGGGVHGLAAAWHLARLRAGRILLLERFSLGHARGSSHGPTRITRSAYANETYSRLVARALREEWPRLEREAGERLVSPRDGVFFGPPEGPFEAYASAVARAGVDVERIDAAEARRRFPELRFEGVAGALHDRTCGVVHAEAAMAALARLVRAAGVEVLESAPVRAVDPSGDPIRLVTDAGIVEAERAVICAGPWTGALLPWLRPALAPIRQTVAYFDGGPRAIWARLGAAPEEFHYGLPALRGAGTKAARHGTRGRRDDPDADSSPDPREVEALVAVLGRVFVAGAPPLSRAETCFYTCTAKEDFVLDLHPECPRIAVGAGFSGHGFKLAPLSGRILAELALHGPSGVPEHEAARATFRAPTTRLPRGA